MPSIEGTIHTDKGRAVRFHLSEDRTWRCWGGKTKEREEVTYLVAAMGAGLAERTDYYQQDEEAPRPPTADEDILPEADADPVEAVLADLAAQFAASHWGLVMGELDAGQAAAARRLAEDHLRDHPELMPAAEAPQAPPLVIPEEEYAKRLPEDNEETTPAPAPATEEPLYPFPAPAAEQPPREDVAAYALASLYASWYGLDLATDCTKTQVNQYLMRANKAIYSDAATA